MLHNLISTCNATYFGGDKSIVDESLFSCIEPDMEGGLYLIGTEEECTLLNQIAVEYSRNKLELGELFEWSLSNNVKANANGKTEEGGWGGGEGGSFACVRAIDSIVIKLS